MEPGAAAGQFRTGRGGLPEKGVEGCQTERLEDQTARGRAGRGCWQPRRLQTFPLKSGRKRCRLLSHFFDGKASCVCAPRVVRALVRSCLGAAWLGWWLVAGRWCCQRVAPLCSLSFGFWGLWDSLSSLEMFHQRDVAKRGPLVAVELRTDGRKSRVDSSVACAWLSGSERPQKAEEALLLLLQSPVGPVGASPRYLSVRCPGP